MISMSVDVNSLTRTMTATFPVPRMPGGGMVGDNCLEGVGTACLCIKAAPGRVDTLVTRIVEVYEDTIDKWEANAADQVRQILHLDQTNAGLTRQIEESSKLRPLAEWHEDYGPCLWYRVVDGEIAGEPPGSTCPLSSDWLVRHPDEPEGWMTAEMMAGSEDVLEPWQELVPYYTHFVPLPHVVLPDPDQDEF